MVIDQSDELGQYVKQFFAFLADKVCKFIRPDKYCIYKEAPLSIESEQRLEFVRRKTLVLDLDETLVHSCYIDPETNEIVGCNFVPQTAIPDYLMKLRILPDLPRVDFQVYKRPYVDEFLDYVSKWYEVVIYTASLESYASTVVDKLDAGRGILRRRFYRQHCVSTTNFLSKNLFVVNRDLSSTFIIDNSPSAYRDFPENAIPIRTYIYDPSDRELINLLPFLDALRFTEDVRTILSRRQPIF